MKTRTPTTRTTTITDRPDTHFLNGWTDAELEAQAREWAIDHGLLDVTVVIVHEPIGDAA